MGYKLKKIDYFNIILLLLSLFSYIFNLGNFKTFFLIFATFTLLRVIILLKRKILWKTRNRLIFSGLFFVITPLFFMTVLFIFVASIMMGQYGITIINNMMALQLKSLEDYADRRIERYEISKNPEEILNKDLIWMKKRLNNSIKNKVRRDMLIVAFLKKKNDGTVKLLGKTHRDFDISKIMKSKEVNGYFLLNGKLYLGVVKSGKELIVLSAMMLNQKFFTEFVSKISDFSIKFRIPGDIRKLRESFEIGIKNEDETKGAYILPLHYTYKYINFDKEELSKKSIGVFIIKLNINNMYLKWKKDRPFMDDSNILTLIYALIAIFGIFIIISFLVGFKILRVITKSINQLTKGTHKIRNGDFSFRIKIKSKDQLQYLAESFNEMAAGINRLLIEEKEKHRLEEELRIARTIQEKLLPSEQYETDDFEIAAINIPAEEIAGDYFDYYYQKSDFLTLIIADVSGKGASAAFYMAELKGVNNYLRKTDISPSKLVSEFHYSLIETFDKVTFITISIAKFIIERKEFVFSRAGHTKGIFFRKDKNECVELAPNGMAIGVPNFSEDKIKEIIIKYKRGDILILFSDGLSEIMNKKGDMFGIERIKEILIDNKDSSANKIKESILESSESFAEDIPNHDDLTLLVLKVK